MAGVKLSENTYLHVAVYATFFAALLFYAIALCGCIPPLPGASSGLSNVFSVGLANENTSKDFKVHVASFAICAGPLNRFSCTTTAFKSRDTIFSLLMNDGNTPEGRALLQIGLDLQARVFFGASVLGGVLLFAAGVTLFIFKMFVRQLEKQRKGGSAPKSELHSRRLRLVICALVFASASIVLVDAYSTVIGVTGLSVVSRIQIIPGRTLQALQWLAFTSTLFFGLGLLFTLHESKKVNSQAAVAPKSHMPAVPPMDDGW